MGEEAPHVSSEGIQSTGCGLTCPPYSVHWPRSFFQYQSHCVVSTNVGFAMDDGVESRRSEEEEQVIVWKLMFLSAMLQGQIQVYYS